ncbi:hypothetical protein L0Z26_29390 (plasmid) [Burkholderia multivorans]|uniref:hypothetical protein n=1 Tax=Burkholderia multivorans TaxID=87883 RepID=UPI00201A091B|nr:hypothetical protein [Burkholderia multivorans]MCO1345953.1 hypothetical protein [Burkholderia multivorans]MCO1445300.1 hypothetical protein [Burkholderia multivorans]UQO32604.1 hypothetical protein L0Z21_29095 [Burkholderia multivorans]UQO45752.1 hypothetical protein L0Z43_28920 [Burkholderia multivorans]
MKNGLFWARLQRAIADMFLVAGGLSVFAAALHVVPAVISAFGGNWDDLVGMFTLFGAGGVCWLQWKYRDWVYPALRRARVHSPQAEAV